MRPFRWAKRRVQVRITNPQAEACAARTSLESEPDIGECREQSSISRNIPETLERFKSIHATGDHDVLRQRRPVSDTDPGIGADPCVNTGLKEQQLERLGVSEANQVQVYKAPDLRCYVDIHSCIV